MFFLVKTKITVPISPEKLDPSKDLDTVILDTLRKKLEGDVIEGFGLVIAVIDAVSSDTGKIFYKTPDVFFDTEAELLVFRPVRGEVVEGAIAEVTQSAVYVTLGSVDALCPVAQLYNDKFHYDAKNRTLRGEETKLVIKAGDLIRARVIKLDYRVPQVIPPMKRGLTIIPTIEVRQKSEIRITLRARGKGLGPLKILESIREEVLKSIL